MTALASPDLRDLNVTTDPGPLTIKRKQPVYVGTLNRTEMLDAYVFAFPPRLPLDVYFVPFACGCNDACRDEWILIGQAYDQVSTDLHLRFLPLSSGPHKIVAKGEGVCRHLATVVVTPETEACENDALYDAPCADDCLGPNCLESCMARAYEYCARHDDPGCARFVGLFERPVGTVAELGIYVPYLDRHASAVVVPAAIGCGNAALSADVAVVAAIYEDEAQLLTVTLDPKHVGEFAICLSPAGQEKAVAAHIVHVANLNVVAAKVATRDRNDANQGPRALIIWQIYRAPFLVGRSGRMSLKIKVAGSSPLSTIDGRSIDVKFYEKRLFIFARDASKKKKKRK